MTKFRTKSLIFFLQQYEGGSELNSLDGVSSEQNTNYFTTALQIESYDLTRTTYSGNNSSAPSQHYYKQFHSELGTLNRLKTLALLQDQSVQHALTKIDPFQGTADPTPKLSRTEAKTGADTDDNTELFVSEERYSSREFHGILPDTGAAGISTARDLQVEALLKYDPDLYLNRTTASD